MYSSRPELPNDIAGCHRVIEQLHAEAVAAAERLAHLDALLAEHQKTIETQDQTIENLTADNKLLRRSLFGSRRERYDDPLQGLLFDPATLSDAEQQQQKSEVDDEQSEPKKKRTSKGRGRRVFPDFLPREEQRIPLQEEDIPEELRNNPNARRFFKKVGEQLELIPMQLKVVELLQEVIAVDLPDATTAMAAAKRPPSLIQSFAGTSLLAYLTVSRFADHLPYYRQEDVLGRVGFRIDRSTQWRWMRGLADGVTPLVDLMWKLAKQSRVLAVDETPVRQLTGRGESLKGYLWAALGDAKHPYDCFFYTPDRRSIGPETFLWGFQGYLLGDAYVAYERIGSWEGVFKAGCWAHARRKFEECHEVAPTMATHTALAYFRQLFDLEDQFRDLSGEERLAARHAKLKPIVDSLLQWLHEQRAKQLPKAKLLGAINYMLNRVDSFTRFLECGDLPMDNNGAERAVKFPILGRKAWLFFGNKRAGEAAAKLFTLTKTCNRLRIDPFAYLKDVYARLPTTSADQLPSLLPDRWIAEHPQHLIQKRVQEALDRAQRVRERRAARRAG